MPGASAVYPLLAKLQQKIHEDPHVLGHIATVGIQQRVRS